MRKFLIVLLALIIIALFCVYIFIPGKIYFSEVVLIKVNRTNAGRFLMDETNWRKWWPGENTENGQVDSTQKPVYFYKDHSYSVEMRMLKGDSILIKNKYQQINSLLTILPVTQDTIAVQWAGESAATSDPLTRVKDYFQTKEIKNNINELLQNMKAFLGKEENLYGMVIDQVKVTDTLLVATQYYSHTYPTTKEIYKLVDELKNYILSQGAIETNNPMLNVTQDSGHFKTMVAIPVNKVMPEKNGFLFKRMVPGKILITEVKGGMHTADKATKQIEMYMNDYHLVSPAIPFQSLVTNRSKEPDTAKWITKIFYPVK
jgi:ribosome-binding factor A